MCLASFPLLSLLHPECLSGVESRNSLSGLFPFGPDGETRFQDCKGGSSSLPPLVRLREDEPSSLAAAVVLHLQPLLAATLLPFLETHEPWVCSEVTGRRKHSRKTQSSRGQDLARRGHSALLLSRSRVAGKVTHQGCSLASRPSHPPVSPVPRMQGSQLCSQPCRPPPGFQEDSCVPGQRLPPLPSSTHTHTHTILRFRRTTPAPRSPSGAFSMGLNRRKRLI